MAGAGAIKAGEAYIQIGTRVDVDKGLRTAQAKLNKFGSTMLRASRNFAMASAAILAPLALAAKASTRFGTGMANISTMLDETSMEMLPRFNKGIQELAVNYGEATDTLQKGLYDILSASVAAGSAMNVLEASAKAARAGMSDTGTAADALTTILNSYKLEASEAGDVSDWFFGVVKRGKTTFAELGPSIGLVASDAAQAGLSLEEMGAALATMTRSGIRTEQAVTRLRAIINAFISPEKEAQKAALKFGLELNANTLKTIGLRGVLQKLQGARIEDVAAIFRQVRALSGMNAMIGGTTGFLKDYDLLLQRAGSTQEAFDKQTEALSFQFGQLKASVKNLAITMGTQLSPMIRSMTDSLKKLTLFLGEVTEAAPFLTKTLAGLGVALAATTVGLAAIGVALKSYAFLAGTASTVTAALTIKMHALTAAIGKYGVAKGLLATGGIGAGVAGAAVAIPGMVGLHLWAKANRTKKQALRAIVEMETRMTKRVVGQARERAAAVKAEMDARKKGQDDVIQKRLDAGLLTGISKEGFPSFKMVRGFMQGGPLRTLAIHQKKADDQLAANETLTRTLMETKPFRTVGDLKAYKDMNEELTKNIGKWKKLKAAADEMREAIKLYLPFLTKLRKDLFPSLFPDKEPPQIPQATRGLENIRALSGATTAQLNRPGQGRMRTQPATETTQRQMARSLETVARNTDRGKINGTPTADYLAWMGGADYTDAAGHAPGYIWKVWGPSN